MRRSLLVLVAIGLVVAMEGPPAAAAPPEPATSVWSWVGGDWNQRDLPSGGAQFTGTESGSWTGTFVGTSAESYRGVIMPDGTLTAVIWIEFTGSVDGVSGELLMQTTVWAKSGGGKTMTGRWVILRGSGGLADLHGSGQWTFTTCDDVACHADWTGKVNFAP